MFSTTEEDLVEEKKVAFEVLGIEEENCMKRFMLLVFGVHLWDGFEFVGLP
jgi:hypothetical protein